MSQTKRFETLRDIKLVFGVSQEQRERKVTVDEVPSGVYLYPDEESGMENIFCPFQGRPNATVFEEAQKEILRLMRIEVQHICVCVGQSIAQ